MKLILALLGLVLAAGLARAGDVTDVLAQMPAKNTADESVLSAKIMNGGAPAIKELCAMLVPLGTGGKDDTTARDAITALVRYVGRPGGEADRLLLSKGFCDALNSDADWEVKSFYICRLQDMGHDEAVATLAPLLGDEKLGLYASAALERIGSPAATEALVTALPASKGKLRIGYIKALGELKAAAAADEIRKSAVDSDKDIQMAALWALAKIGDIADADLIINADKAATSAYQKSQLDSFLLVMGHRLAENGSKDKMAEALNKFFQDESDAPIVTPTHVRIAAARLFCEIQGEGALNTLLPVVEKGNVQFQAGVLDAIAKIPGDNVTPALVGRLKAVTAADLKIEFLRALAKRNDAASRPAVIDATKESDPAVRTEAITTLVALGRDEAIAPLVAMVVSNGSDAKVAAEALARMPGDKALAAAAGALDNAGAKGKIALLELLAARGATAQKESVLKQATDADGSVRLTSFKAMEKIGGEGDAPKLIDLAIASKDDADAAAALTAAAACAGRSADAEQRADAFVAALAKTNGPRRATLEKAVARVGGAKALEIVLVDLKSDDKAVRQGALEALSEWQGPEAIAPLLDAAQAGDTDQQVTAVRGVVRILRASPGMTSADKAVAYGKAISAAKRPEEKKMILGALAVERGQEIFDVAASMLDEEGLKPEASLAVIKTALPQPKGQPGLKGAKVIDALKTAIPACPDGGLKADAQRYLQTLQARK